MFRGVNALSLDAKGRLAIPTKYRPHLVSDGDNRVVVTVNNSERCLWLYPLVQWESIEKKLVQLPSLNAAAQTLKRILMGHATDTELDGSGRILLSAPLRKYAGLEKRAVLIGQGNKFEIWNESTWNDKQDEWLSQDMSLENLPIELESLSL